MEAIEVPATPLMDAMDESATPLILATSAPKQIEGISNNHNHFIGYSKTIVVREGLTKMLSA